MILQIPICKQKLLKTTFQILLFPIKKVWKQITEFNKKKLYWDSISFSALLFRSLTYSLTYSNIVNFLQFWVKYEWYTKSSFPFLKCLTIFFNWVWTCMHNFIGNTKLFCCLSKICLYCCSHVIAVYTIERPFLDWGRKDLSNCSTAFPGP